jgi:hypothetical protein
MVSYPQEAACHESRLSPLYWRYALRLDLRKPALTVNHKPNLLALG